LFHRFKITKNRAEIGSALIFKPGKATYFSFCTLHLMRIVLIPDKFKGSLSAEGVIAAMTRGILKVYPEARISSVIASDGGDGFLSAVEQSVAVKEIHCPAVDPLFREMRSRYLLDPVQEIAYIELAECSGMVLLRPEERNPINTTTLGTGMQIRDALSKGARKIYVGLGGSATHDGGTGIAHALGYRFLDVNGDELPPTGGNLIHIQVLEKEGVIQRLGHVDVYAINDVDNPLLGKRGAAHVYAPQKGAGSEETLLLEKGMEHLVGIVRRDLGKVAHELPGAGAAGGTAFGLHCFLRATFEKGVDFMFELTRAEELFKDGGVDLLITGEGAIDEQTLQGKLIDGAIRLGKRYQVPVLAVCGKLDLDEKVARAHGLTDVLEIRDQKKPTSYSMENAAFLTEQKITEYLKNRSE
jgi:glycerate kinase